MICIRTPRCWQLSQQPLGQVEEHRKVQEGLTPEESEHEALGADGVQPLLGPLGGSVGRLQGHLRGVLVVVPVVTLNAVVAREIALQGRQDGDPQLASIFADRVEELFERLPVGLPALDDEAVLRKRPDDVALLRRELRMLLAHAVEHIGHVTGNNELRIGEGVHQEHALLTFSIVEGHAYVEHRGLHDFLPRTADSSLETRAVANHCR